jgi:hypothetical protein
MQSCYQVARRLVGGTSPVLQQWRSSDRSAGDTRP